MSDLPDIDEARSFSDLLARMEEGALDRDATGALEELIAKMRDVERDHGGKPSGEITLTVSFKLDGGLMEVRSAFKVKPPKQTRARSVYWPTDRNMLSGRNPRQRQLPFGVADISASPAGRVRDVTST